MLVAGLTGLGLAATQGAGSPASSGAPMPTQAPMLMGGGGATSCPNYTSAPPTILVIQPSNGTIFTGGQPIAISFALENFNFTAPVGQPNECGYGHLHVYVNGAYYELIDTVSAMYLHLPDDWYNITLELVNNNHSPLNPSVPSAMVNLSLALTHAPSTATPSIVILSPANNTYVGGPDVTVSFAVFNFLVVQPIGQPNAPNEGHIHILVNGKYYELLGAVGPAVITGLAPGTYIIEVELVNNNHTPLGTP